MKKFRKLRNILLCIVVVGLGGAVVYVSTFLFTIRTLDIRGTSGLQGADVLKNQNLLFISTKDSEERLYDANATIQSVVVTKVYPDTLRIEVTEAADRAYLTIGHTSIVINSAYRITEKRKQRGVPSQLVQIVYHPPLSLQSLAIGDSVPSSDIETSIFFIEALAKIGVRVSAVDIVNFYMILLHSDEGDIIVTAEKSKEHQYEILKEALRQLKISGKKIQSIDVRFDKPVITLAE